MDDNFNIDSLIEDFTRNAVLQIIKDNWDYFCEVGAVRPMPDFEFCIDTENAKAICCCQPKYGVHEANIMSKQISDLEHNICLETVLDREMLYYSWQLNHIRNFVPALISLFGYYVSDTELLVL